MNNIDKFLKNIRSFSNSLVIKFEDVAYQTEQYVRKVMMPSIEDRESWKYYENISGNQYLLDENVEIKVIETEQIEVLTPELLNKYPITRKELLKTEDYYKDLIKNYPDQTIYIHGCLFPVDKTVAIEAEDGTILGYNKDFLQQNEDNIIEELEEFIKNYIKTYYNYRYSITDELYLPSFLAMLYSYIPYKIVNIMINNIKTYRVNDFFLELYFRSKFDIWDNIQALKNKNTLWWLYSNLDCLSKNIGKNKTLDTVLNKIFDNDNIGVGINYIKYKDPVLNDEPYNPKILPFNTDKPDIFLDKLNKSFLSNDNKVIGLSDLLEEQFKMTKFYTGERKEYIKESIVNKLSEKNYGTNLTKTLDLSTLENFTGWNLDIYSVIFDYWTYFLATNRFGSFTNDDITTLKVDFLDPNTKRKYSINSKQAYYMFLKLILFAGGKTDLPLKEVLISNVLNPDVDLENILNVKLYQDGYTQKHKEYILNNYPYPSNAYASYLDLSEFLNKVTKFYKDIWILSSNSENAAVSGNLRMLLYLLVRQERINIHPYKEEKTIDELLAELGISFEVNGEYDYMASMKEIIYNVLGVTSDPNAKLEELLNNLITMFTKLTSYTLQAKGSIKNNENIYVFYNNIQPFMTKKGIIRLKEDRFLLEANCPISFTSRFIPPSEDRAMVFSFDYSPILNLSYKPLLVANATEENIMEEVPSGAIYNTTLPTAHIENFPAYGREVELFGVHEVKEPNRDFMVTNPEKTLAADELPEDNRVISEHPKDSSDIVLPDFITYSKTED